MNRIESILLLCILLSLGACKKVIDIKLKDSDIKFVIEAVISNEPGSCRLLLSKTKPFNSDNQFLQVSGAVVQITDNNVPYVLPEKQPGVYENNLLTGSPGHVYQLSVTIDNNIFRASCVMPQPVKMDSLYISRGPFGQFKFATISYTDPGGVNNGYRFIQYVNGVKEPTIFWENDEFTDGQSIIMQLDASADKKDDPRNIKTGDEVMVEMLTVDESIYKYWYSLRSGGGDGSGNTAAPANPVTNITGGALGYFSAHTVDRKVVIAP